MVRAVSGRLKPEFLLLAGAVEVHALAQGALRRFTQMAVARPSILPMERWALHY